MRSWKLVDSTEIPGILDQIDRFLGTDPELSACLVSIPTTMDIKVATNNIGGEISAGIRSLEIWRDSEK